jgi:DNA ligase 1
MYGALLLAVYDPAADRLQTICKCGTGFSDADLAALPARLAPLARAERPARVDSRWHADVRFPRFTGRWRDDKAPEDATTVEEVLTMYRTARRMPSSA